MYQKPIICSLGLENGTVLKKPENGKINPKDVVYAYEYEYNYNWAYNVSYVAAAALLLLVLTAIDITP